MIGRPSVTKRRKEQARAEKQQEKAERRQAKKASPRAETAEGEDPDLAGIVPGPQPVIEEDE